MLKSIFVSEVRIKILTLLLLNSDKSFHVRAIVRYVGSEINAIRRELDNLIEIKLLTRRQSSNRIYYTANTLHPIFIELLSLVAKEQGICADILEKTKELGNVEYIMTSRAFVRGRTSTALDVDLFCVGDIKMAVLEKIIKTYEAKNNSEINYSVMTSTDFKYRKRSNDQFINKILAQSRIMLIGDEEKFCSLL